MNAVLLAVKEKYRFEDAMAGKFITYMRFIYIYIYIYISLSQKLATTYLFNVDVLILVYFFVCVYYKYIQ